MSWSKPLRIAPTPSWMIAGHEREDRERPGEDLAGRPASEPEAAPQAVDVERQQRATTADPGARRSGGSRGRRCCSSRSPGQTRVGRLVSGLVAEEILEVLAALLDPDQAELERCRTVADRVVGAVVTEVDLERVRRLACAS